MTLGDLESSTSSLSPKHFDTSSQSVLARTTLRISDLPQLSPSLRIAVSKLSQNRHIAVLYPSHISHRAVTKPSYSRVSLYPATRLLSLSIAGFALSCCAVVAVFAPNIQLSPAPPSSGPARRRKICAAFTFTRGKKLCAAESVSWCNSCEAYYAKTLKLRHVSALRRCFSSALPPPREIQDGYHG